MSFVEKHKLWLLPLLGLGVLGVVYMNLQMFKKPPQPAPRGTSTAAAPATALPAPAAMTPPPAVPPPPGAPGEELWADLRALEAPAPALADAGILLGQGERPVDPAAARRMPSLRPDVWTRLRMPVAPPSLLEARPEAPAAPLSPPAVTFVGETPSGPVAWIGGRPFRPGDLTPSGFRVTRIALDRVRFERPGQVVEQPVLPLAVPPKEAP